MGEFRYLMNKLARISDKGDINWLTIMLDNGGINFAATIYPYPIDGSVRRRQG